MHAPTKSVAVLMLFVFFRVDCSETNVPPQVSHLIFTGTDVGGNGGGGGCSDG